MTTGTKLKLLREKRRLSQEALAFKIGVVQATIGNWEKGKSIKYEYIAKLTEALDVKADYFSKEQEPVSNPDSSDNNGTTTSGFEITIKAPNNLFDDLNKKMDFIINKFNGAL